MLAVKGGVKSCTQTKRRVVLAPVSAVSAYGSTLRFIRTHELLSTHFLKMIPMSNVHALLKELK